MRGIRGFIPETTPCIPTLLDSAHDTVLMGFCKLRKDFLKKSNNFLKTKKILAITNKKRQKKKKRGREKPKILVEDDINLNKMNC